jgi:tripeptidyl-peptidase-2
METGTGLIRALRAIVDNGCHVVNMSYGEYSGVANSGRFVDMVERLVRRHNVIFVSSAGNNGPALTTSGAPGV